ncbi:hypothetical protein D9619_011136 [Psilocybe cf. subviscida]|uniref:Uncharacterized protein n=1 Tax=Psilocybe cf. subviscida TaxID=2480587 RepID=A0A8H5BJ57_9AGAR|nr:hypothetical protein D9619_011136 [Psilocybe cf. subviscida]
MFNVRLLCASDVTWQARTLIVFLHGASGVHTNGTPLSQRGAGSLPVTHGVHFTPPRYEQTAPKMTPSRKTRSQSGASSTRQRENLLCIRCRSCRFWIGFFFSSRQFGLPSIIIFKFILFQSVAPSVTVQAAAHPLKMGHESRAPATPTVAISNSPPPPMSSSSINVVLAFFSGFGTIFHVPSSLKSGAHTVSVDGSYDDFRYIWHIASVLQNLQSAFLDPEDAQHKQSSGALKKNTKLVWSESPMEATFVVGKVSRINAILKKDGGKEI